MVRGFLKVVAGLAALVFLRAPLTSDGLLLMLGSAVIAAVCVIALMASGDEKNADL
jgi:hypothetical protein